MFQQALAWDGFPGEGEIVRVNFGADGFVPDSFGRGQGGT